MTFAEWLEDHGCDVVITQEDDGGGYICLEVTVPEFGTFDVTVTAS